MLGAKCVKALQQIAGGIGVVPVVATIVDHDMVASASRARARALSTRSWLESRISKTESRKAASSPLMLAAEVDAARPRGSRPRAAWAATTDASSCCRAIRADLRAQRRRGWMRGSLCASSYLARSSRTSATVEWSGVVGPEESASSERRGTSGSSRLTLSALRRGHGEAAAFDGGKMLAECVDLVDGRARGKQQLVEGNGFLEGDVRVERKVEHGRAAAGDEEKNQRVFAGFAQKRERGAGGGEGVFVGQRDGRLQSSGCASCALSGSWLVQHMPRRPLRRFMRSSRVSSIGPAALPMAMTKMRL